MGDRLNVTFRGVCYLVRHCEVAYSESHGGEFRRAPRRLSGVEASYAIRSLTDAEISPKVRTCRIAIRPLPESLEGCASSRLRD